MPGSMPFLLFPLGDTPSKEEGRDRVRWPQADLCPGSWQGTFLGAGQPWHLILALPCSPPHPLSAQPMKTNWGGGVARQPVSFPVQLPSWGGGDASCHLLAKCCLRQLSATLGPELPFPGQGLGSSGILGKWVPLGLCLAFCLSWCQLGTGLVREGGCSD